MALVPSRSNNSLKMLQRERQSEELGGPEKASLRTLHGSYRTSRMAGGRGGQTGFPGHACRGESGAPKGTSPNLDV